LPDTVLPEETTPRLFEELNRKAMFFKYANHYATLSKTLPEGFEITDEILKNFEGYLKEKGFGYEEEAELKLKELREAAERGRYGKSFQECFERISKSIETEKSRVFERYDGELRNALKLEILTRMKGEKEAIKAALEHDPQLELAVKLVKSKPVYTRLLTGKVEG
jgi:carboxyl-terminal processing protease